MNIINKKSTDSRQAHHSSALSQCQPADLSRSSMAGFMRVTLFLALAMCLVSKPYIAQAGTNAVTAYLQAVAQSNAQELGGVVANNHWTRIEFGKTYIDPVVVVEASAINPNSTYVVGIRNVDAMGFEIGLKSCNNGADIPLQENVNYSVIDKSRLPSTQDANTKVRQQFSWGECPAAASTNGVIS